MMPLAPAELWLSVRLADVLPKDGESPPMVKVTFPHNQVALAYETNKRKYAASGQVGRITVEERGRWGCLRVCRGLHVSRG